MRARASRDGSGLGDLAARPSGSNQVLQRRFTAKLRQELLKLETVDKA